MLLDAETVLHGKALAQLEEGGVFSWRIDEFAVCIYPLSPSAIKAAEEVQVVASQNGADATVQKTGLCSCII